MNRPSSDLAPRFKNTVRGQQHRDVADLCDGVAEDDLVHFVIQAVERLPLCTFALNPKGCGDEQYPPHMMLALLFYCCASRIFSSRRIERAT